MSQGFYGFPRILDLVRATTFKAIGKAGATNGAALAGGTAAGAPVAPAGPFDVGDVIVDATSKLWICTSAGTSQSSPGSFTQVGFDNPMTTSGDLITGGSAGVAQRLAIGSSGAVLSVVSGAPAWAAAAGASLTTANATLSVDVTPSTSAWTDVLSLTLAAGTWYVCADLQHRNSNSGLPIAMKIWDGGSNEYAACTNNTQFSGNMNRSCIPVLSGTTTVKVSARNFTGGNTVIKATTNDFTTGNTATQLNAVKLA